MTESTPRSGSQFTITGGGYRAIIASVGATLRALEHRGTPLTATFHADDLRPSSAGAALLPWPNRISEGRYRFAGANHQLMLTEPERSNAIHGLACWLDWEPVREAPDAVELRTTIAAQPGYPYTIEATARFAVDSAGLHWSISARNAGDSAAPYGVAVHPYLVLPTGRTDDWSLELAAERVLDVAPDTKRPLALLETPDFHGGEADFRKPRTIGAARIDHAMTGINAGADGLASARLRAGTDAGSPGVVVTWDPEVLPWAQVFTADLPGLPEMDRRAVAIEPMTCPPDAYNSGDGLIVLEPGQSHEAQWHIAAISAAPQESGR